VESHSSRSFAEAKIHSSLISKKNQKTEKRPNTQKEPNQEPPVALQNNALLLSTRLEEPIHHHTTRPQTIKTMKTHATELAYTW